MWLLGDLSSAQSKLDWSGGQGPPQAEPTPGGEGWPLGCLFKSGCPKSSPLSPLQSRSSNRPPPHPLHQAGCPECLATASPASRGESYAPSHTSSFPHLLLPNARSQIHPPDYVLFQPPALGSKASQHLSCCFRTLFTFSPAPLHTAQWTVPSDLRVTKPHGHFGASSFLAFQDLGTLMVMPFYGTFSHGYGFQAGIPISSLHSPPLSLGQFPMYHRVSWCSHC